MTVESEETSVEISGELAASAAVLAQAKRARSYHRSSFDGAAGDVVRLPDGAITELVSALAPTVAESICQIVPFTARGATSDSFTRLVWRELADRGVSVLRLYIVPPSDVDPAAVDAQIRADGRHRGESRKLNIGGSREWSRWPLGDDVPLAEMWLIDGHAVVSQEMATDGPPVWVVSVRDSDVQRAIGLWKRLWEGPAVAAGTEEGLDLTEPLLESAPMIHTMAPMSCTRDHVDRSSCSWYHGVWQYLRIFDMVSSPVWHAEFYRRSLQREIGRPGRRRVLITGAADYSMLAYVIAAARDGNKLESDELDVHVLDQCPTPLNACRWYADRVGLDVGLHEADVLKASEVFGNGAVEGFDLIVTDAFLTRFSPDDVRSVLINWRELLRPGGRVVTTVRLHPRDARSPGATRPGVHHDVLNYALRLRQRALGWRSMMHIDLNVLLDAARDYALKITSTDIGDLDDVLDLVRRHGFDVVPEDSAGTVETEDVEGELVPTRYARLVLSRH